MDHCECRNLFGAGKKLLEGSGLVRYCDGSFVCNSDEVGLEEFWGASFDQEFGRYMAWVWFSVGAENLVKAALVCHELLKQKQGNSMYPFFRHGTDKQHWLGEVLEYQRNAGGGYGELVRPASLMFRNRIWAYLACYMYHLVMAMRQRR